MITWSTIATSTAVAIGQRRSGASLALGGASSVVMSGPLSRGWAAHDAPWSTHGGEPTPSWTTLARRRVRVDARMDEDEPWTAATLYRAK